MEEELANLSLLDEEEEAFQEESAVVDCNYQFCLVGFSNWGNDAGRNSRGDFEKQILNPNLTPLEFGQQVFIKGQDNWHNMGIGDLNGNRFEGGPTDLMLEEENN
ncbi:hypothetical protein J1N35_029640 [Gossypium stocksii]|uniref:Uncharacterized protein n=1 Tax=Gossypium stocksii TaxID=47602 RepID=A0A9D3UY51_9ROSI|nr:hypothetical protein J1N35_029640 [Gossypium stocksii]